MIVHPEYMKRDHTCIKCGGSLPRGSEGIKVGMKLGAYWTSWKYYHLECFISQLHQYCLDWFGTHSYHSKLGRKKKASQPIIGTRYGKPVQTEVQKEIRRLKALQRYHKKQGHLDRVDELEKEIQSLITGRQGESR